MRWIIGALASLLFAGLVPAHDAPRYSRATLHVDVPAVTLVDASEMPVALRDELAQPGPTLVQFVFTTCTTICPLLTQTAASARRALPALRVVSITIDPDEDTPARLADYARRYGAGDGWRFLTGGADDIVAVQRAFDAYTGNKMRHLPLSFLRTSPRQEWLRLEGPFTAADIADEARALGDASLGRRLYRDGVLASGERIAAPACATCHRRSGYGGVEGRAFVPPVAASWLFDRTEPRRVDRFRALFQEELAPDVAVRLRAATTRPPYTRETLAHAVTDGRDSAGRALDALMPRYALTAADHANLAAYLETLSTDAAHGVDAHEIRFATVVAGDVAPARRDAMIGVMQAWVKQRNADNARRGTRPPNPMGYEDDLPAANRAWALDVWTLTGAPDAWPAQLAAHYRERTPFALVGGIGDGDWRPVHAFCEARALPCVFALTDRAADTRGDYGVYLSGGLPLEARTLGRHLAATWRTQRATQLVQIASGRDAAIAATLRDSLAGTPVPAPVDDWRRAARDEPTAVVLWLDADGLRRAVQPLQKFTALEHVYVSRALAGDAVAAWPAALRDKTILLDRETLAGDELPHAYRARAWLRSRGLARNDEAVSLGTYYAMATVEAAVAQMLDHYSRDYFLEIVEREAELVPNPGPYPSVSLGAGQRVAAKRCRMVRYRGDLTFESVGDWVAP